MPRSVDGKTIFDVEPEDFAKTMKEIAELGAWIIGGCCGTTSDHIRKMVELCKDIDPKPIEFKTKNTCYIICKNS